MRKVPLLFVLVLGTGTITYAQTSVFQDGKGESAYKLLGNAVSVNTGDKSLAATLKGKDEVSQNNTHFNSWAMNVNLAASDGSSALKSDDGFLFNGSIGASRIWKRVAPAVGNTDAWTNAWYINGNFLVERNKLYDLSLAKDKVFDQGNAGWKFAAGRSGYSGDHLWGYELNLGQATNAKDIKQTTVSTIQSGGTDSIKLEKQQSAYATSVFQGTQFNVQLNADYAWALTAKKAANNADVPALYLAGLFRSKFFQLSKPQINPAIGLYIANPGKPQSISAGFNVQESDLFNVLHAKDSSVGKRIGISFTAGFSID
ncbi:hypothetical protein [Mucilaginibacter polytrichastri]|uniref:DUF5723 domain-containing protein n=1 Tax=Mucilaginibacter polytrichastri TaxID=1302689 RepID=A0A1Q5ZRZ9_9SPHI|nr:hypothetical protein [Mucilaginibacter polytrichastri]OKS84550.1 hypothetical protein RG47T_5240 [Mucilaginibacter polytrichastri]SFT23908.1 hypothetical protein SAMN04487890_12154 [Mucilaginibacter polytrichastri]